MWLSITIILNRVEFIQLALDHKPINLGQGFPDYAAPKTVTDALASVGNSNNTNLQQYTRGYVSIHANVNCQSTTK